MIASSLISLKIFLYSGLPSQLDTAGLPKWQSSRSYFRIHYLLNVKFNRFESKAHLYCTVNLPY